MKGPFFLVGTRHADVDIQRSGAAGLNEDCLFLAQQDERIDHQRATRRDQRGPFAFDG